MRIKRSWVRVVAALTGPAICTAFVGYFGYYTVWGTRGLVALAGAQRDLAVQREELAAVRKDREGLQHRIELLEPGHIDRDLVEEIARDQLSGTVPGQIAVPRKGR